MWPFAIESMSPLVLYYQTSGGVQVMNGYHNRSNNVAQDQFSMHVNNAKVGRSIRFCDNWYRYDYPERSIGFLYRSMAY